MNKLHFYRQFFLSLVYTYTAYSELFSLGIRDSIMIAHSFQGEQFGPAQNLHGATYTVDVDFLSPKLEQDSNWVIDIGEASNILAEVLQKYNYKVSDISFPDSLE